MTVFQRVVTMAKRMLAALRSPSMALGWLWSGFSDCQKPNLSSWRELDGEETAVPVGQLGWREKSGDLLGAMACEEPLFDEGVDVVKLGHFDEDGRYGRRAASDELQVADGSEEGGSAALSVLPAFALLEAKAGKEAGEEVELSA
jgi:hypothetical protein